MSDEMVTMSKPDLSKRFWLFEFDQYYPVGGLHDLRGTYDTLKDAKYNAGIAGGDYTHILDTKTRKVVGGNDIDGLT